MNEPILSMRSLKAIVGDFRSRYGVTPSALSADGVFWSGAGRPPERSDELARIRAQALREAVRWGEPNIFFMGPGLLSWMNPMVRGNHLVGGLTGVVRADAEQETIREAVNHLAARGMARAAAHRYVEGLPVWPQERIREATARLQEMIRLVTGWSSPLLDHNRERAAQQRQIAEEIHRRKIAQDIGHPVEEERRLLALIRVGDRKSARGVLNRLLGDMFLASANPVVVKARAVEMMGYLVRAAVEHSPHLEPLIAQSHRWTASLIETKDFEELAAGLRSALDDFMEQAYLMGCSSRHAALRKALTFLQDHYREPLKLSQVATAAGVSPFRIAHVLKEATGRSFLQHVHRLRIETAQRMLEEGSAAGADVAFSVGYHDQSYFIRHFRRYTGMTPGQYRTGTISGISKE